MNYVIETARALKRSGTVLPIFGVIAYADSHPHVKRVLRDEDYWAALDHISGPSWPVFAVRSPAASASFNRFSAMVTMPASDADPSEILAELGLDASFALPLMVVFTFAFDDVWRTALPLHDDSELNVYAQLRFYFEEIALALRRLAPENRSDAAGVFTAVNYHLKGIGEQRRVRNLYGVLKEIRSWIPL